MADKTINFVLKLDDKQYSVGLTVAGQQLQQFEQLVNKSMGNASESVGALSKHIAAMGHSAAILMAAGKLATLTDGWTSLNARVALASQGLGSAQVAMRGLTQVAGNARVDLGGLAETYGTLSKAGAELGYSQQRVLAVTETLSKAMTLSGGSAESARAAMVQFGQGLQAGTLRGDELNSVLEQAPRLAQALAEGLGQPVGALKTMAEQGQITTDAIFVALERMRGKIDSEFAQLPTTIGQSLTVLQNSFLQTIGVFDQASGISSGFANGVMAVSRNMDVAVTAAAGLVAGYGVFVKTTIGATVATRALGAAVGALGGPISAVATVLGLGASAWLAWKAAGTGSEQAVEKQVAETHEEVIKRIDAQIAKLRERNRLADAAMPKTEDQTALDAAKKYTDAYARYSAIVNKEGEFANVSDSTRAELLRTAGMAMGQAYQRYTDLADAMTVDAQRKTAKARESFMKDYRDQSQKMAEALAAYDKEYKGKVSEAEYKKDTDDIRAKFRASNGSAAINAEKNAYDGLVASLEQKIAVTKLEMDQQRPLTESQRQQIALDEALSAGKLKLTDAHKARVQALIEDLAKGEKLAFITRQQRDAEAALAEERADANAKLREMGAAAISVFNERNRALQEGVASAKEEQGIAELEFSMLGRSSKERQIAIDYRRIELKLAKELRDIDGLVTDEAYKNILRQRAKDLADVERSAAASKAELAEAANFINSIDSTAHDAFVSVAKDGMDAFKRIGDTLKSAVLDMLYQMTVKRWIISIGAQISGSGSQGSDGLSLGNAGSLLSNGSSLLSLGSQWASGTMSTANVAGTVWGNATRTGIDGLLATNGAYGTVPTSASAAAGGWASYMPVASGALGAYGFGKQYGFGGGMLGGAGSAALAGGMSGLASGSGFMAGASGALSAIPVWGWAAMAVMALLGSMDDSGTPHMGGAGAYSKDKGTTLGSASEAYTGFGLSADQYMEDANKEFGTMSKSIVELLDGTSKAFGGNARYSVGTGFADDSSKDGAWGALRIVRDGQTVVDWGNGADKWPGKEFADGEEGRAAYMAAAIAGVRDALKEETPGWADAMLDALGDAPTLDQMAATVTQINQIQAALESLGHAMPWLADLSDEVTTSLVMAAGDMDGFTAMHQAYLQAMYGEQELQALGWSQLTDALAELGLQMPTSIATWRALTEAQDRNTEAGQQAYLTMIQLGPTFAAQMQAMLQEAGVSVDSMSSVIRDGMLGRLSAEDAGGQVADMIVGGIYNAMASRASAMVTDILMQGIVQPMVQAASTGAVISSAASQAAVEATVAQAKTALTTIGAVLNDPTVQAAIRDIGTQTSVLFAGYTAPVLPVYTPPKINTTSSAADSSVAAAKEATNAWDKAYSALERAVAAQRQAAEEQLAAATAVYDLARSNARELRNEVEANVQMDAAAGRSFIESALQILQTTGYLPEQDALGEAVAAARTGLDGAVYTNAYEYNRDRLILAGQLQQIADLTEPQKTAAERQLDYLDGVLDTAKAQLDKLEGIDNSVLSVGTAITAWLKAIPASARSVAAMPSLPAFSIGTDYVPADMLALIHEGEQIVPKAYNPHANGQGAGRTDDLLRSLIDEVRRLHARLAMVERHNERAALALDDAARGRRPFKTQEVSA